MRSASCLVATCLLQLLTTSIAFAETPSASKKAKPTSELPLREIYIPFEDLNVILDNDRQRVFLTRDEYEALVAQARSKPQSAAPQKVALIAAEYDGQIEDGRALINGLLTIEVLEDGLYSLPLPMGGVGIRSATLDDRPAPLMREGRQSPMLLIQGKGLHKLQLQLTAALQTASAQQTLQVLFPTSAATKLRLSVPGNVDVKGGAQLITRTYDAAANRTLLQLQPQHGEMSIVMSLNNRLLQEQRLLVTRSVIVDEVTQGYERIHATISYRPLHGVVDKLRLAIPAGFEVTTVESALLARWEERSEVAGKKILDVTLREPTNEQLVLRLVANRSPAAGQDWLASLTSWKFPHLEPLETAGNVAVIGLLVEDRLQPRSIETANLLPVDSAALTAAIPVSVLKAEPGAPVVRQVVSYFAPAPDHSLSASFVRPEAGLAVAANSLLVIGDQRLTLQGGFALMPRAESIFDFRFTLPAGWQVADVTDAGGTKLHIERHSAAAGGTRVSVRLPKRISVGETRTINYRAEFTPAGWLADWTTQPVEFPKILVEGAVRETGAIAAQTIDDLQARPDSLTSLTPLLDNEKAVFGLSNIPTALAYRFEDRSFAARLIVERTTPRIAAQIYSLLTLERDNLVAHFELNYDVREARTRRIAFSLPLDTPAEISIHGLDNTQVKESSSREDAARRHWTVQLAERQMGRLRLAIDFTQRVAETSQRNAPLPLAQAEDVEFQSALVAVQGDAELDVHLTSDAREVDIGELAGAERPLGRRVVGAFGYVGTAATIRATTRPHDLYALPAALIERAELVTKVSAGGRAQSVARYDLWTKATLLEIRLPPDSTLWTVYLDDQPTKPQKQGGSLLLSLPAQQVVAPRKLQLVYESPSAALGLAGTMEAIAPLLLVRAAGNDTEREIPHADLVWQLVLPSGYSVRGVGGTVDTSEIPPNELALTKALRVLYEAAGGIRPWSMLSWRDTDRSLRVGNAFSQLEILGEVAAVPARTATPQAAQDAVAAPGTKPAEKLALGWEPASAQAAAVTDRSGSLLTDEAKGKAVKAKFWALDGVSSLKIDLQSNDGSATTFHSLGDQPRLEVAVIDRRRVDAAAWGLASLIVLVGVGLTQRSLQDKAKYIIVLLIAATVPPLMTTALDGFTKVFDFAFFAACLLIVYYPFAGLALRCWRWVQSKLPVVNFVPATQPIAPLLVAAFFIIASNSALAQQSPPEDLTPIRVPADAIIVPYDPENPSSRAAAEKILVPYPKYVELWNLAHPDKRIDATPPPCSFAIAGTKYEATLGGTDSLALVGQMEIDVYADKPVAVPLHLAGGVLERVTVDGEAARLQLVESLPPSPPASKQKAPKPAANAAPTPAGALPQRLLLLHLSGKGHKSVQLQVRLGLSRQGGWRIVRGQIPAGPAAALTLHLPDAGTEIRQASLADRATFESKAANETIETALGNDGVIQLQWRPKVAEGMVDQGLTANSVVVFDVREDSLRVAWQVRLDFGRAYRDSFSLAAPAGYIIEQVTGDNIRGWTAKREAESQRIDVTLLKPAQGSETLTLQLAMRGRVGEGDLAAFDVPSILVEGASLEQGDILVRKSSRLDLRTLASTGISRADSAGQTAAIEKLADATEAAVLVVGPYQTFRFVRPGFRLALAAAAVPQEASAEVRAALRIADRDTAFDAAIVIRPKGQPLYRVRVYLPDGFSLERLAPGDLEWSTTSENGRQLLTVQLLDGRTEEFTLTLLGKLAVMPAESSNQVPQARSIPLPDLEILDMDKQEGQIAIVPDPDTDVRIDGLKNCVASPTNAPPAWLKAEQQSLAKALVRYRAADYAATLTLTPRTPLVSARTITNIKITPRSIEETVLLNLQIEQAGIRRVVFQVPEHLAKARLKARLLKQKTIAAATNPDGQPIAGMVRITLELQDYVRGEYAVLLEQERMLATARQTVVLPIVESARTDRRLVAIENAGRDEVTIDPRDAIGLEPVNRQQQAWRELAAVLGENVTQAYAALDSSPSPSLAFTTLQREQAQRAGARIGLATTLLVVDRSGAYRALVQYRVSNATEQFLQLSLPAGARLWTAKVAGEPVKPAQPSPPDAGVVRIPLVKTAEGEGDYLVELKYGGQLQTLGSFGSVSFPLIRETNINVELSQVRLLLPESQQWFNFQGTMRLALDQMEMERGFQSYLCKRIQEGTQALSSTSDYTKVRGIL